MKTFDPNAADFEERMDAWLATRPVTPSPDFVARTMARIRAEATLVTSARAGDETALEALLDRWLEEQPVSSDFEPEQLVISTRRAAAREEQEESRPQEQRTIIRFPVWARSAVAMAAAACVVFIGYVSLNHPEIANAPVAPSTTSPILASLPDDATPAPHYAWNMDPNYISDLSSSVSDLAPVASANDVDAVTSEFGTDDSVN